MRRRCPLSVLAALCLVVPLLAAAAPAARTAATSGAEAWKTLDSVRDSLRAAGPTRAEFVQTYVPAGFSTGDSERGEMSLALPDCLRWDYRQPYEKSFLLCGDLAHYWSSEDRTGRRYKVDRANEPGLDLLLLGVEQLRNRYRATQRRGERGQVEVHLEPREDVEALASATLVVDPAARRLVGLSYRDREGNQTRFEISAYRALARDGVFDPPRHVRWEQGE